MYNLLLKLGQIAGIGGTLFCVVAVLARLSGMHWMGGFETLTLLQGGIAAMTFACLCLLSVLAKGAAKGD